MTVNFEGGADDIPTFSFADLRFCANANNKEYFRRWFDGKVVIFGSVLDADDRRLTSKRFATGHEGTRAPRCTAETKPVNVGLSAVRSPVCISMRQSSTTWSDKTPPSNSAAYRHF